MINTTLHFNANEQTLITTPQKHRGHSVTSTMIDKPPALHGTTISESFAEHLAALHEGRKAFIEAESSAKIRKALRHQSRNVGGQCATGDKIYVKREDSQKWKGPGKVIGQDGKSVFIRYGNVFLRVPAYHIV